MIYFFDFLFKIYYMKNNYIYMYIYFNIILKKLEVKNILYVVLREVEGILDI